MEKNKEQFRERLKASPRLKQWLDYIIMNQRDARPRWYVRLLAPFYQHRGCGSKIYWSARMDTPPYRRFWLGKRSVIESFCCINNAVGDVIIGDHTRIGIHCTVIGPVCYNQKMGGLHYSDTIIAGGQWQLEDGELVLKIIDNSVYPSVNVSAEYRKRSRAKGAGE